jgi:hypothetical protein
MPSGAIIGAGTRLEVETSPGSGVYVAIAELKRISPPNAQVDEHEVTNMDSEDLTKEYIAGFSDPGEMACPMNYIPGSDSDVFIRTWRATGLRRGTRVVFNNGAPSESFLTFVKGYERNIEVNAPCDATLTLRVAGASTFS